MARRVRKVRRVAWWRRWTGARPGLWASLATTILLGVANMMWAEWKWVRDSVIRIDTQVAANKAESDTAHQALWDKARRVTDRCDLQCKPAR